MTEQAPSVHSVYQKRLDERRAQAAVIEARHGRLGTTRFAFAMAAIALAIVAYRSEAVAGAWVWLPVAVFVVLAIMQWRLSRTLRQLRAQIQFWEHGVARIEDKWRGRGPGGAAFLDEAHTYAHDLDIFGDGSLYQLLCQARTAEGQQRLASWLSAPASQTEIGRRQAAVTELGALLDLRETLAVAAQEQREELKTGALRAWVSRPSVGWSPGKRAGARAVMALLAAIFVVVAPLAFSGRISGVHLAALIAVDLLFMSVVKPFMAPVAGQSSARLAELDALARIVRIVEAQTFQAPILQDISKRLQAEGLPASRRIRSLGRLVSMFDVGRNQLLIPVAYPLFWPHQFAMSVETWRARHGAAVVGWLDAVADLEALVSLAAFAYEHPGYAMPELRDGPACVAGDEVGHPLLPAKQRVCNDVDLGQTDSPPGQQARLILISGSNMSGKSTYLRTVGINTVLALAGSAVCARRFLLTPVRIGATLNIHDSLAEGRSRFYAEITRIRQIVAMTEDEGAPPVLFLFDEILHGTNSDDRQVGAAGVLRGLLQRKTLGLVTTHDLALTRIAEEFEGVRNVHLQDHMEGDEMKFDYRLRPGVVTRSNALALMRAVGLDV